MDFCRVAGALPGAESMHVVAAEAANEHIRPCPSGVVTGITKQTYEGNCVDDRDGERSLLVVDESGKPIHRRHHEPTCTRRTQHSSGFRCLRAEQLNWRKMTSSPEPSSSNLSRFTTCTFAVLDDIAIVQAYDDEQTTYGGTDEGPLFRILDFLRPRLCRNPEPPKW